MQEIKFFYVPDEFWPAYDYEGNAQYVALYWTPYGDEAEFNDGRFAGTADWGAYQALLGHPLNASALEHAGIPPWYFGSSDAPAEHWLIVDRKTHKAYHADSRDADKTLREQWGDPEPTEPVALTEEQIAEIERAMQAAFEELATTPIDLDALMQERHARVRALQGALDAALGRVEEFAEELALEEEA